MGHLRTGIVIDAPALEVEKVARDPHGWNKYIVGLLEPRKITGDGLPGTVVEGDVLAAGGRHLPMVFRVTEHQTDPDGRIHVRIDMEGEAPGWETWDMAPQSGGCAVSVEREYSMPWGVFGKVFDRLVVRRAQARDLDQTLKNLKLLVEEAAR